MACVYTSSSLICAVGSRNRSIIVSGNTRHRCLGVVYNMMAYYIVYYRVALAKKARLSCARVRPHHSLPRNGPYYTPTTTTPLATADDDSPNEYRFGVGNPVGAKSGTHTIIYMTQNKYTPLFSFFLSNDHTTRVRSTGSSPPPLPHCIKIILFEICRFS